MRDRDNRPLPLVPAEVDIRDFAFMPLDVSRLRDSDLAANETPEACWAAVLLWAASWHQIPAASIPNDDRWIAKQAGYAQRGKIAKEWSDIRSGALRNWVECSDGRLYHPVVAEKALEAWRAKLKQRWSSELARIKKHNQRHGTSLVFPSFEEWTDQGCPQGHPLNVPRDSGSLSPGTKTSVPGDGEPRPPDKGGDKHSKGHRQGQGQGQQTSSDAREPATMTTNELHRRLVRAAGGHVAATVGIEVVTPILDLIAMGCDLERHILPAIAAVVPKLAKPLGSWGAAFLRQEILALKAQDAHRVSPQPGDAGDPVIDFGGGITSPLSTLQMFVARGTWVAQWGPGLGDPGCRVPEPYRAELRALATRREIEEITA